MSFSLLPQYIFDNLTDITPEILSQLDIRSLLMDFDNTIVPYTADVPQAEILAWLQTLQKSGVFLGVVSNSHKTRVVTFCRQYALPCVTHSKKPFQKGIGEAVCTFALDRAHTALVGDQIFTDVLGANCGGLVSILITPIHLHNFWLRLRNLLEKPFIFAARGRRQQK